MDLGYSLTVLLFELYAPLEGTSKSHLKVSISPRVVSLPSMQNLPKPQVQVSINQAFLILRPKG